MDTNSIENYGIIGNMRSAALVSITGGIDFFCFPSFDSQSVFAALLDEQHGGSFRIDPLIDDVRTKQLYLPDTNILLTRFLSTAGVAELTDFMPVSTDEEHSAYTHQVIRILRVIRGEVRFRLRCAPRFDYASGAHTALREGDAVCFRPNHDGCPSMALHATIPLRIEGEEGRRDAVAEFTLCAGESAAFTFGNMAENESGARNLLDAAEIENQFAETSRFWREWMRQSRYKGRWREVVNRSALALKILTCREYGSLVAAATLGLPERVGGARNWDYRYTWLRDSAFAMYAFMRLGFTEEARGFTRWLRDRVTDGLSSDSDDGPLQVIYSLDGSPVPDEVTLEHLSGFRGSRPVRLGNGARTQLQLDIYGELMDAIYLSNKYVNGISNDGWRRVRVMLAWLGKNWEREDEGIWEVRNGRRHFLHSRLMCWVAFDRAIRLAQKRSLVAPLNEWFSIRDAIHEDIFNNFWSEKQQSFVQAKGSETLDAATLLMPLLRFISPTDPRWISTMAAIESQLTEDALVFRYSNGADGLDGTEGSFIACSFWRIECLARQGETDRARLLFDKMLGYANHLGLYAEELGSSGEQLGNFPQALTHLALISAATYLDRKLSDDRDETWQ
jgi:GH15 family glucan-1,4-alpha-glucosidase